jgi:hypothetical protein
MIVSIALVAALYKIGFIYLFISLLQPVPARGRPRHSAEYCVWPAAHVKIWQVVSECVRFAWNLFLCVRSTSVTCQVIKWLR